MRTPNIFTNDVVIAQQHIAGCAAIFDFVKVVSRSDSNVIITGESRDRQGSDRQPAAPLERPGATSPSWP